MDPIVLNLLGTARERLVAAGCETPRLDAELLLAHALGESRIWLYKHPIAEPAKKYLDSFADLLNRRERREPVAYLTGQKAFFGLDFQVNRHVLIPRPETELLVETAIQILQKKGPGDVSESPVTVADVGTGSGCIAVALAKNLDGANLFALDISNEALDVARQNASKHGGGNRITFLPGDLLQPLAQPVDLIVSNPPYVSRSELRQAVSPEISRYEPRLALDGGDDGLEIIRQLLPQAREKLKPGGSLLVEIGSTQGEAVRRLAKAHFPGAQIQLKQDLARLDRLLVIRTG